MESDYDINKRLLNNLREAAKSKKSLLGESVNDAEPMANTDVVKDEEATEDPNQSTEDVIDVDSVDLKDEQAKINEIVGASVKITFFKVYPNDGYAVMSGTISDLENLEFQLTTQGTDGIYITTNDLQLTESNMKILHKFTGYYASWKEAWTLKVNNEYTKTK